MHYLFDIVDNTADGAFIVNKDRNIIYWNNAARKILGYTSDEVINQPCYKILRGCDDKGRMICHHNCNISLCAFAGKVVPNYTLATCTKSGKMCWINISILTPSPSTDDDSLPVIIHLFRDATQAKQNEQFIHQMFDTFSETSAQRQNTNKPTTSSGSTDFYIEALTNREYEVLSLLVHGSGTANIAQNLSISITTVRNHIQKILHKFQVHSRLEAVAYALEHGLVPELKTVEANQNRQANPWIL